MSDSISQLNPKPLWSHFAQLNAVPRPSKKEERVQAWVMGLGQEWGLETTMDEVGNVLIRKPATSGMENRVGVVLQSHLDMVCQKTMTPYSILTPTGFACTSMATGCALTAPH